MGLLLNDDEENGIDEEDCTAATILNGQSTPPPPQTERALQDSGQPPYQNIRIIPGDGIKLLSHLPTNYLDAILITFPDPWPKESQECWRVIQGEVVREMHRVLKTDCGSGCDESSGGRVYIATDAECFDLWTREVFHKESFSSDSLNSDGAEENRRGGKEDDDDNDPKSTTGKQQQPSALWKEVVPCPDRKGWLPVASYYEQKGLDEGRCTMLQCWQSM